MATRIANGARAQTVIRETRAAPTSRPSTDKPQALLDGLFAGLDVSDHVVDRLVDRAGRPPAREVLEGRRIGLAPAELLEALVIGLLVGDERDLRVRAGPLDHPARELDDRRLPGAADVERASDGAPVVHEQHER